MKDNKAKLGLLIAALLTIGQVSNANDKSIEQDEFAPIEALTPEHRASLLPQIELLRKTIKIDWNSVALGINQNGELVLKGKEAAKLETTANPTCWGM
jgi:hypothetical protein